MRIAALDLGSNSFHLVVLDATQGPDGLKTELVERSKEMVRLGESTLLTGVIPTDGFERGLDALQKLRKTAARFRPDALLVAATSAIREASNGVEFVQAAREAIGAEIRVIDGHEEARLIYFGARSALGLAGRRVALFDLGGGSLEVLLANETECLWSASLKLGVLRIKEQWLADHHHETVDEETLGRLRNYVRAILTPMIAEVRAMGFDFVAFTAGTARGLRALANPPPSPGMPLPDTISLASLTRLEALLASLPSQGRAALPGIDLRRIDTLLPGAIVLRSILELCEVSEATYCQAALREGMVAAYLAGSW